MYLGQVAWQQFPEFCKCLQIFGGLVLGCIETKCCKSKCILQHFYYRTLGSQPYLNLTKVTACESGEAHLAIRASPLHTTLLFRKNCYLNNK